MPHPSHGPHSSTPTLGQSLDCNPPLPLKLAMGEEFGASRVPTFIKGYCFPLLNSPVAHHHLTLAVARSHQMRLEELGLPHLAPDHTHLPPAWEGNARSLALLPPSLHSGLEVNSSHRATRSGQRSGSLVKRCLKKGHAESSVHTVPSWFLFL